MGEYRVVCDNPEHDGGTDRDTLHEAWAYVRSNRKDECPNLRVVRRVPETWEDVPEPEPLPDLPVEVWATYAHGWGAPVVQAQRPGSLRDNIRIFRATVSEWTEVTE